MFSRIGMVTHIMISSQKQVVILTQTTLNGKSTFEVITWTCLQEKDLIQKDNVIIIKYKIINCIDIKTVSIK